MEYRTRLIFSIALYLTSMCFGIDKITPSIRRISDVKERAQKVNNQYSDPELLSYGILDVTKPPYSADNTGQKDVTSILQKAIIDARDSQVVCYLPGGEYKVSDTLEGIIGVVNWDNWTYGPADPWVAEASFYYPCVLTGSRGEKRAKIVLADNALGFNDPCNPRPVLYFWARSWQSLGNVDPNIPMGCINFNQKIMSLDIDLGKGNSGAIGVDLRGAEGSSVEDVQVIAEGAFAGFRNAPGSGGAMHKLKVTGGRYGLYISGSQPSPLISDVKLSGQTHASIFCQPRGPLTIVGAEIDGSGIRGGIPNVAWCGAMNIIDTVIRINNDAPAIKTDRSIFMDNVFVHLNENSKEIAVVYDNPPLKSDSPGWTHVVRYVAGGKQRYPKHPHIPIGKDPVWLNKTRINSTIADIKKVNNPDNQRLLARHQYPDLPNWNNSMVVNVKEPPFNAKGDGKTDDTEAIQSAIDKHRYIFLPKGTYCISKPLKLKSDTAFFGITNIFTEITTFYKTPAYSNVDNPQPLIITENNSNAATRLEMLTLKVPVSNPCVYALNWRSGGDSFVRNIYPIRPLWHPNAAAMGHPMIQVTDSGGGRWYNQTLLHWWAQGPGYRHMLVKDTSQPIRFYHLQPQHARCDVMIEFNNASNIDVYSMKCEGDVSVLWLNKCSNIRIFGYTGSASSVLSAVFRIDDCKNIQLANISPFCWHNGPGGWGALGKARDPIKWNLLKDGSFILKGIQQFVLYQINDK